MLTRNNEALKASQRIDNTQVTRKIQPLWIKDASEDETNARFAAPHDTSRGDGDQTQRGEMRLQAVAELGRLAHCRD